MAITAAAAVLSLVCSTSAAAQSSTGGLRGTVKDNQGIIPGVTVQLVNDATGIARETITNESGEYADRKSTRLNSSH